MKRFGREAERGMPDFMGDGELFAGSAFLTATSGVKLICFTFFDCWARGVVGTAGNSLLRSGLLGLKVSTGRADGATCFLGLAPGYRRIDLRCSNLPGVRMNGFGSDLGMPLREFVEADFVRTLGVDTAPRFGFEGDLDKVGICVV